MVKLLTGGTKNIGINLIEKVLEISQSKTKKQERELKTVKTDIPILHNEASVNDGKNKSTIIKNGETPAVNAINKIYSLLKSSFEKKILQADLNNDLYKERVAEDYRQHKEFIKTLEKLIGSKIEPEKKEEEEDDEEESGLGIADFAGVAAPSLGTLSVLAVPASIVALGYMAGESRQAIEKNPDDPKHKDAPYARAWKQALKDFPELSDDERRAKIGAGGYAAETTKREVQSQGSAVKDTILKQALLDSKPPFTDEEIKSSFKEITQNDIDTFKQKNGLKPSESPKAPTQEDAATPQSVPTQEPQVKPEVSTEPTVVPAKTTTDTPTESTTKTAPTQVASSTPVMPTAAPSASIETPKPGTADALKPENFKSERDYAQAYAAAKNLENAEALKPTSTATQVAAVTSPHDFPTTASVTPLAPSSSGQLGAMASNMTNENNAMKIEQSMVAATPMVSNINTTAPGGKSKTPSPSVPIYIRSDEMTINHIIKSMVRVV